ncbi:MAG: Uracil-DNA glycosylase [Flavobacteriaceae bacterium]|nr:MAG: Uracil-DNA glycosylase [Flavobacteriaceae bacterium]
MHVNISPTWAPILQEQVSKDYFKSLNSFVDKSYRNATCYPAKEDIFKALQQTCFNDLRVVIIGQDPYHDKGQANGLSFSVKDTVAHPPSLKNIFKELESDLGIAIPKSGNLERWATQGVLLLNATLTVAAHKPASHQKKGWETFTDAIISEISIHKNGVVFLLWGGFAKKKAKKIDVSKHHILSSGHPSPLSANRGYWFGNKHFSLTNEYLVSQGKTPINW